MNHVTATLVGYHGRRNFGDDIFLRIAAEWLVNQCSVNKIHVAGLKSGVPSKLSGVVLNPFQKERYLISRFMWLDILHHALRSKILVFSAGSIFTIQPFFLAWLVLKTLKLVRGKKFRIVALGVSVGPLRNVVSRYWCPKIFELMDIAVLRDESSSNILKSSGRSTRHIVSYDLALVWPPIWEQEKMRPKSKRYRIGVCLHPGACYGNPGITIEKLADSIIDCFISIKSSFDSTIFELSIFSACSDPEDGDVEISNYLVGKLECLGFDARLVLYDGNNIEEFAKNIQQSTAIITSRMHVGVISAAGGVPLLQIAYADKVNDFYNHSGIGSAYTLDPSAFTPSEIYEFINLAIDGKLDESSHAHQKILESKRDNIANSIAEITKVVRAG